MMFYISKESIINSLSFKVIRIFAEAHHPEICGEMISPLENNINDE